MDSVYQLDTRIPLDVTLQVTMGGGVLNYGKKMDIVPGDRVILLYDDRVIGSAPVLSVVPRTARTLEVAHGRVEALTPEEWERVEALGEITARGGAYLP